MPLYEYQCSHCNHKLDELQSMSEAPLTDCPACGTAHLQKLVSAAAFQLKGTGWYVTDFKDKGAKKENKIENKIETKIDNKVDNKSHTVSSTQNNSTTAPASVSDTPKKTDTAAT